MEPSSGFRITPNSKHSVLASITSSAGGKLFCSSTIDFREILGKIFHFLMTSGTAESRRLAFKNVWKLFWSKDFTTSMSFFDQCDFLPPQ